MRPTTAILTVAIVAVALSASIVSAQQLAPATNTGRAVNTDTDPAAAKTAAVANTVLYGMTTTRSARYLLRNGLDYLNYQQYDRALKFLRDAETHEKELNDAERLALKQGIERAQRGMREAADAEDSYALSERSGRRRGFTPATPKNHIASSISPVVRRAVPAQSEQAVPPGSEGSDDGQPIRLTSADSSDSQAGTEPQTSSSPGERSKLQQNLEADPQRSMTMPAPPKLQDETPLLDPTETRDTTATGHLPSRIPASAGQLPKELILEPPPANSSLPLEKESRVQSTALATPNRPSSQPDHVVSPGNAPVLNLETITTGSAIAATPLPSADPVAPATLSDPSPLGTVPLPPDQIPSSAPSQPPVQPPSSASRMADLPVAPALLHRETEDSTEKLPTLPPELPQPGIDQVATEPPSQNARATVQVRTTIASGPAALTTVAPETPTRTDELPPLPQNLGQSPAPDTITASDAAPARRGGSSAQTTSPTPALDEFPPLPSAETPPSGATNATSSSPAMSPTLTSPSAGGLPLSGEPAIVSETTARSTTEGLVSDSTAPSPAVSAGSQSSTKIANDPTAEAISTANDLPALPEAITTAPTSAGEQSSPPANPNLGGQALNNGGTDAATGLSAAARATTTTSTESNSVLPGQFPIRSTLRPEQQREVEAIARRQEDELRQRLQNPPQTTLGARESTSSSDLRTQTQLDISRAPSPAEARPIKAIPVPEDWVPLLPRNWTPQRKYWAAAATCHLPLYFQDPVLERYGHNIEQFVGPIGRFLSYPVDDPTQSTQRNQLVQPFFSAGLMGLQIIAWPYNLIMDPPWEAQYDLGYYRPGDNIPTDLYWLPLHGYGPPLHGSSY